MYDGVIIVGVSSSGSSGMKFVSASCVAIRSGAAAGIGAAGAGDAGAAAAVRVGATVRVPAWLSRSFTFAIRVCGSKGLARNPSQPTRVARS